jgi:hypothetical protein
LHCLAEQVACSPAIGKVLKMASEFELQKLADLGSPGKMVQKFLLSCIEYLTLTAVSGLISGKVYSENSLN